jgi:hypothetical protein
MVWLGSAWQGFLFLGDNMVGIRNGKARITELGGESPTNGGAATIETGMPYVATVEITGVADILFHRWNVEAVDAKSKAAKGSKAKKSDDIESYVYRNDKGELCVPGEYLRMSIIMAAKYKQDPRSPRKSAQDLFKAGVIALTPLASLGVKHWDYEHACRVTIQRNGITRVRLAVKVGWKAEFDLQIQLPEYISPELLMAVLADAGRLVGLADFRPTYGRFSTTGFAIQ